MRRANAFPAAMRRVAEERFGSTYYRPKNAEGNFGPCAG
jgi:hypothetical protein